MSDTPHGAPEAPILGLLKRSGVVAFGKTTLWDQVRAALSIVRDQLNGMGPGERALLVEAVKSHLGRVEGISSPAQVVRAFLGEGVGSTKDAALQGRLLELEDPVPWPDTVDGAAVLDEIVAQCHRYLFLPAGGAEVLALWAAHTHALSAASASPLLVLTSPEKRCGKTTTLRLMDALVRRPLPTTSISGPALFRAVERWSPTLLIDEADASLQHDEMHALLCGGHTPDTAFAVRTVGDDHEVCLFKTWCPKALAKIGKLDGVLEDRSLVLRLERKTRAERRARLRHDRRDALKLLRRKLARWVADHLEALAGADPEIPEELHDRAADNWRPLLAIADCVGRSWPARAREAARVIEGARDEAGGSRGIQLLAHLQEIFHETREEKLPSERIVEALNKREDGPWAGWNRGRGLTPAALARLLREFEVRPRDVWAKEGTRKGYRAEDLAEPWARYSPAADGADGAAPSRPGDLALDGGEAQLDLPPL